MKSISDLPEFFPVFSGSKRTCLNRKRCKITQSFMRNALISFCVFLANLFPNSGSLKAEELTRENYLQFLNSSDPWIQEITMFEFRSAYTNIPQLEMQFLEIATTNHPTNSLTFAAISCITKYKAAATNALPLLEGFVSSASLPLETRAYFFRAMMAISPLSDEVNRTLNILLNSPLGKLRDTALESMYNESSFRERKDYIPQLAFRLISDEPSDNPHLIRALIHIGRGSPIVARILRFELSSPSPVNRAEAVAGLSELKALKGETVSAVSPLLFDDNQDVRLAVGRALGSIGTNAVPALPDLERALSSTDTNLVKLVRLTVENMKLYAPQFFTPKSSK